jgi:opacity protein-like surface antigen
MNRISLVAAAVTIAVSAHPTSVRSQSFTGRPIQVGLMGGFTKPAGDLSPVSDHSGNAGVLVTFGAPVSHLRFRLDGQWQQITGKVNGGGQLTCVSCTSTSLQRNYRILDATANAVYGGTLSGPVSLYVIGGVGVYGVRGTTLIHQGDEHTSESVSATRFGFNGGAGASVRVGHVATFIEASFHQLVGSNAYANNGFYGQQAGAFQFVPINVGIVF